MARAEIKALCIEAAPLSFGEEEKAISHVQQVIYREEPYKDDRATKRRRKEDPHHKG